jgi:DNA-binding NarL/FixJ family response regulator
MPALNNLRILIADDHEIVRRGLKALLASKAGWMVCAEANGGREAVALAAQYRPDIVLMDIAMPGLNGLEATHKIRKMLPKTQVLILSLHYSDQLVREVLDSGARGARAPQFLLRKHEAGDLLDGFSGDGNA